MKLTTLIMITVILHVSATTLAQKVTLNEKNARLVDVFNEINKQTGYDFVFTATVVKDAKPVTIDVKNEELKDALGEIFQGQDLDFSLDNKIVVIKAKEPSLIDNLKNKIKVELTQVTVAAKVNDELGQPLPGATVKQKGTNNVTTTDNKGNFSITVPDNNILITFSYIGYEPQELAAKDVATGSAIVLKASVNNLNEVIVNKGYYREKKELSTGDATLVTAATIEQQPVSDPIQALIGRVPGLQITQTSGMPGAYATIRLRGQNSITNGNSPLFIIDGVPYASGSLSNPFFGSGAVGQPVDPSSSGVIGSGGLSPFNNLNPEDIESIEVLKDADATAIYGSRGANGVILITTKKGKAGATRVDVDFNSGDGKADRMLPLLNTQQYLQMRHEAYKNDGVLPASNAYDVNGTWDTTRYTNWEKLLIGNTAHFTNSNVTLSGGTTNTQFLIGAGYSNQTTVLPGDYHDEKGSVHLSLNHTSTNQKFHTLFTAQYVQDKNVLPQIDFITLIPSLPPDAPAVYDANGNLNWANGTFTNPLANLYNTSTNTTNNLIGNLNIGYDILPGLKIQANFGYNRTEGNNVLTSSSLSSYPANTAFDSNYSANTVFTDWIINPQLNYTRQIGKGKLDALIGAKLENNSYNSIGYYGFGFSNDELITNVANANTFGLNGTSNVENKEADFIGRLNYVWDEKYIVNITVNRDGSSKFGPGSQYGDFGAAGIAWIFSKEKFIADALPFLSFGKLRASYGTTGSDQITPYQYLSSYKNSGNYQNTSGLAPSNISSPYFAWERDNKLEGGIELGFLKDRIHLEADYYRNRSGNQLVQQPLPSQDGFSSIQSNLPAVVQNTGLEFQLNTVNVKSKDFSWSSMFSLTIPRNKLVSFPGLAYSSYSTQYVVGQPISGLHYYYTSTGVNPQTGVYTFKDLNNNGALDQPDKQLVYIGQNYYGGLANSVSYKGLQLDVFFQYVKQNGINYIPSFGVPGRLGNMPTLVLTAWQQPGDVSSIEKFTTGGGVGGTAQTALLNYRNSTAGVSDASFIRLENIALSYALPAQWQHSLRLQNTKIFINAQNLLTFTGYKGFDPETQGLSLPPLRMISLGLRTSL